jgi:acid phosphatase family membrane protein YuiD
MKNGALKWRRVLGEAVLIIASVFVAIALESAWQERQQARAAQEALAQMLDDLRQDRSNLDTVAARQQEIDRLYAQMREWLADPATLDGERM